jgi:IclR family transcriptional regulator, acetate operon repressor
MYVEPLSDKDKMRKSSIRDSSAEKARTLVGPHRSLRGFPAEVEDGSYNDRLRTADRALSVLEHVANHPGDCTVKEIAASLGLNLTTCYHLTNTLLARSYLLKSQTRTLRLGPAIGILSTARRSTIEEQEKELGLVLGGLARTTQETAYVCRWIDGEVIVQAVVEGPQPLRVAGLYVGMRGVPHCRASGKAILAHLPADQLDALLHGMSLTRNTPNTITDAKTLRAHLLTVRETGYAIDNEEFALGISCVAAPYFAADASIHGAVSVSVPVTRFRVARRRYIQAVVQAARSCSRALGFVAGYPPPSRVRAPHARYGP